MAWHGMVKQGYRHYCRQQEQKAKAGKNEKAGTEKQNKIYHKIYSSLAFLLTDVQHMPCATYMRDRASTEHRVPNGAKAGSCLPARDAIQHYLL